MTVGSLFSGIGGFDYGLESIGMKIKWQVENDKFCNKVLANHWPNVKRYGDIKDVKTDELKPVDLICGGFPCQPFSCAGKRKGKEDDRYLWPEMLRIITGLKPRWIIGENVAGIVNMELEQVCTSLEIEGYKVRPIIIPACAINAWHRRDRVWILGYAKFNGHDEPENGKGGREGSDNYEKRKDKIRKFERTDSLWYNASNVKDPIFSRDRGWNNGNKTKHKCSLQIERPNCDVADSKDAECQSSGRTWRGRTGFADNNWDERWPEVATRLCRVDDGISNRVDRLKSLGNAVVPQIVMIIGKYIMEIEGRNFGIDKIIK